MISKTALAAFVAAVSAQSSVNATFENFVSKEFNISLSSAIQNIGGTNSNVVPGADEGIVVASPSTINPDYFYTWTRDSALTQLMLTDELIFGTNEVNGNSLQVVVEQYTTAQAMLQEVTNPSGALWPAGQGLGEPKFYTNKTRYNGAWGRPQNDGPALRATTMMEIAAAIKSRNPQWETIVKNVYWPIIYNDLLYVAQYWNTSSYDLWEEVNGNSVFTTTAQHRALVQGSIWADMLNETCEPCQQAPQIACFLSNSFWNETGNYIIADINTNQVTRSGINCDVILAATHGFDINASCDAAALQPCNSRVLATHKVYVDSFRNLYPINHNASSGAVLTGRYPEDNYYGGNPWYITTLAAAEMLYDAAAQFNKSGSIAVDSTSLAFWQDIYPSAKAQTYTNASVVSEMVDALRTYGDGFVQQMEMYTPMNGTLNEQINKTTGEPTSAIALTWSFAAFVTAADRRAGNFPPSWGANSSFGNDVAGTCQWSAYNSTTKYQPAEGAGASAIPEPCETEVLFGLTQATGDGQNTYIVGNTSIFGDTLDNTTGVIQVMRTQNATNDDRFWFVPAWVPAGIPIEYRYVLLNSTDQTFEFENITRIVTPPQCGDNTILQARVNGSFPNGTVSVPLGGIAPMANGSLVSTPSSTGSGSPSIASTTGTSGAMGVQACVGGVIVAVVAALL